MPGNPPPIEMHSAYAHDGAYIGAIGHDQSLFNFIHQHKIKPERRTADVSVASIGKDKKGQWWGWSHRAIAHFKTRQQANAFAESVAMLTETAMYDPQFVVCPPTRQVIEPLLVGSRVAPEERLQVMLMKRRCAVLADQFSEVMNMDKKISFFCEAFGLINPITGDALIPPVVYNVWDKFAPTWVRNVTAKWVAETTASFVKKGYTISRKIDKNIANYIATSADKSDTWTLVCSSDGSWCFDVERNGKSLPVFIQQQSELGSFMCGVPKSVAESNVWDHGITPEEARTYVASWKALAGRLDVL